MFYIDTLTVVKFVNVHRKRTEEDFSKSIRFVKYLQETFGNNYGFARL